MPRLAVQVLRINFKTIVHVNCEQPQYRGLVFSNIYIVLLQVKLKIGSSNTNTKLYYAQMYNTCESIYNNFKFDLQVYFILCKLQRYRHPCHYSYCLVCIYYVQCTIICATVILDHCNQCNRTQMKISNKTNNI